MGWIARTVAFLSGPEFVVTADEGEDTAEGSAAAAHQPLAEVVVLARATSSASGAAKAATAAGLSRGPNALKSPAALRPAAAGCGSGGVRRIGARTIARFDPSRQVYSQEQLSPLPFTPPPLYSYLVSMLAAAFKVAQIVATVLMALMLMQQAALRAGALRSGAGGGGRQRLLLLLASLSYPLLTLMLVTLSSNEMAARRFMYYRLMSLQVVVDFENRPFYKHWFFPYFMATFALISGYSLYAAVITSSGDRAGSVLPQWSVMSMQSILLFMFWLSTVSMEEGLVPLNRLIENSPASAKELITRCAVVEESALREAVRRAHRRRAAFRRLPPRLQDEAARELLDGGDSPAALFDLLVVRRARRSRTTQDSVADAGGPPEGAGCGCLGWLRRLGELAWELTVGRLYAWTFCLSMWSPGHLRLRRSAAPRAAASLWPYPADEPHLRTIAAVGSLCLLAVAAVEVYAVWLLLLRGGGAAEREKYGVLECRQCYQYHDAAGQLCRQGGGGEPAGGPCLAPAVLGFCSLRHSLLSAYTLNSTQLGALDVSACPSLFPS